MNVTLKACSDGLSQIVPRVKVIEEDRHEDHPAFGLRRIAITTGVSAASAGDLIVRHDAMPGTIIGIDDTRPDDDWSNGGYGSGYRYGSNPGYGYDTGYRYGDHGVVSPRSIARNLQRHDYRYISQPVLHGRLYQVKAINPHGHKVKLYIDAYSGRIVKVKA